MPALPHQRALDSALAHHQAGRLAQAREGYLQLQKGFPRCFEGFHLGGVVALQMGKATEAVNLLRCAVRLRDNVAVTHLCLGTALLRIGQTREAEIALKRSIALDPNNVEALTNLGALHSHTGRLEEALQVFEQAKKLVPTSAQAWAGSGNVHLLLGAPSVALAHQEKALQLDPRHPKARCGAAQALQQLHRVREALANFDEQLRIHPTDMEAMSQRLLLLNYVDDLSPNELFQSHLTFGKNAARNVKVSLQEPRGTGAARRRVAFLSPDLRRHSVAYFLEPILAHLDRSRFEVYLYHDHFTVDDMSSCLRGYAAQWRNFVGQDDETVSRQILADAPDILVDLAGHTGFNRLALLARRHAPVQLSYLGYPNTTGLQTMDYRFTDAHADPVGETDALHTESLVRFAPCAWAYQPPKESPEVAAPPSLANGFITFGSFNALSKLSDRTLRVWKRLLDVHPTARLLLKSSGLDASHWQPKLAALGFPIGRVTLLGPTKDTTEHLAAYGLIDIALDPLPYHGTTTTCEALWMGLPVVTLAGDRHASRVGVSLLTAAGRGECIAYSEDDYVRIASDLARCPELLAASRREARERLARSPLFDHAGQAARFGDALEGCLEQVRNPAKLPAAS